MPDQLQMPPWSERVIHDPTNSADARPVAPNRKVVHLQKVSLVLDIEAVSGVVLAVDGDVDLISVLKMLSVGFYSDILWFKFRTDRR
jgi:hypothetical protein